MYPAVLIAHVLVFFPAPTWSEATNTATYEKVTFLELQTPYETLAIDDVVAETLFVLNPGGPIHCFTDIQSEAGTPIQVRSRVISIKFTIPCSDLFNLVGTTFEIGKRGDRGTHGDGLSGFNNGRSNSTDKWLVGILAASTRGATQQITIDAFDGCTVSGRYNGFGLNYIDSVRSANTLADVTARFRAHLVINPGATGLEPKCRAEP